MHDLGKIKKYNISVNDKMFFFFLACVGIEDIVDQEFLFLIL